MIQGFLSFLFSFFSYNLIGGLLLISTLRRRCLRSKTETVFFPFSLPCSSFPTHTTIPILAEMQDRRLFGIVRTFFCWHYAPVRARVCVGWSGYSPHYAHSRTRIRSIHTHAIANRTERRVTQMLRRVRVLRQDFL